MSTEVIPASTNTTQQVQQTTPEPTPGSMTPEAIQSVFDQRYSKHKDPAATGDPTKRETPPANAKLEPKEKSPGDVPALRREYDKVVGSLKEAEGKLKEHQDRLLEFEGTVKERDALKASIAELQKQVETSKKVEGVAALEMSEEFQQKYVVGLNSKLTDLKELAEYADINPDDLSLAMSKTGKERFQALQNALDGAPTILQNKIIAVIEEIEKLSAEKHSELSTADQRLQARIAERDAKNKATTETRSKNAKEAWEAASALAKEYGLDDKAVEAAAEFFKSNRDPRKSAEIVVKGHAADVLRARVTELEAEITRLSGAAPGVVSGVPGAAQTTQGFRSQMVADFNAISNKR